MRFIILLLFSCFSLPFPLLFFFHFLSLNFFIPLKFPSFPLLLHSPPFIFSFLINFHTYYFNIIPSINFSIPLLFPSFTLLNYSLFFFHAPISTPMLFLPSQFPLLSDSFPFRHSRTPPAFPPTFYSLFLVFFLSPRSQSVPPFPGSPLHSVLFSPLPLPAASLVLTSISQEPSVIPLFFMFVRFQPFSSHLLRASGLTFPHLASLLLSPPPTHSLLPSAYLSLPHLTIEHMLTLLRPSAYLS